MNRTRQILTHSLAIFVLGVTVSCGSADDEARERVEAASAQAYLDAGNHLVADVTGSYICVLRRPDDLAAFRAQYSHPVNVSASGALPAQETDRPLLRQLDPRTAAALGH